MERQGVWLLPVVERAGGLVGLVSREHILSAWRVDPLLPVAMVMAARKAWRGADGESPAPR
jgi:hypothetical protein